jgi:predicted GTPase
MSHPLFARLYEMIEEQLKQVTSPQKSRNIIIAGPPGLGKSHTINRSAATNRNTGKQLAREYTVAHLALHCCFLFVPCFV